MIDIILTRIYPFGRLDIHEKFRVLTCQAIVKSRSCGKTFDSLPSGEGPDVGSRGMAGSPGRDSGNGHA